MKFGTQNGAVCLVFIAILQVSCAGARQVPTPTPAPAAPSATTSPDAAAPSTEAEDKPRMIEEVTVVPQTPPSPTPTPTVEPGTPAGQPSPLQDAPERSNQSTRRERRTGFPDLNIYLPEGEFDIRTRRLIKN